MRTNYTEESFSHPDFAIWVPQLKEHGGLKPDGSPKDGSILRRSIDNPSLWMALWTEEGLQYGLEFGGTRRASECEFTTLDPVDILAYLNALTDDERMEIISRFCHHCGSKDTSCQCWNDE